MRWAAAGRRAGPAVLAAALGLACAAEARVDAAVVARLDAELTPVGAERAGDAQGAFRPGAAASRLRPHAMAGPARATASRSRTTARCSR
jgi:hypothetical protein